MDDNHTDMMITPNTQKWFRVTNALASGSSRANVGIRHELQGRDRGGSSYS